MLRRTDQPRVQGDHHFRSLGGLINDYRGEIRHQGALLGSQRYSKATQQITECDAAAFVMTRPCHPDDKVHPGVCRASEDLIEAQPYATTGYG